MRRAFSFVGCFFLSGVSFAFPLLFAGSAHGQTTATEIDYTGSLLGYYRMEPTETTPALAPVKAFLDFRNADATAKDGPHLLLGMGDNFGPEFGASLQLENTSDPECAQPPNDTGNHETRPESLYKDDDRVAKLPQCDNVLNFFMHAGFRAVVPGREDFMYTARWLRTSAVRLARASNPPGGSPLIKNSDHRLYLLAANLRIQLQGNLRLQHKGSSDPAYSLNGRCPLLFSDDPFSPDAPPCVAESGLPQSIDWLNRLDSLTVGNGQNLTSEATRQLATDAAMTAAGRESVLKLMVSDQLAILQSAWGERWPQVAALFGKSPSGEAKRGSGKSSGKMGGDSAGKGSDLSAPGVANLISGLQNWPQCQPGASFANAAQQADAADVCTYRAGLEQVLQQFSGELSASKAGKTVPACKADDGSSSVGACFVLMLPARKAATNGLLRTIAQEQRNIGYTIATQANGKKILIIGVVGPNTMKEVSQTNLRQCINDKNAKNVDPNSDEAFDGVHWPGDFGGCDVRSNQQIEQNSLSAITTVTDPVVVSAAVVRAAELTDGPVGGVVLMAQMPHTEAEVLSARVWEKLAASPAQHPVNIVLSEAGETETGSESSNTETGYDTPDVTFTYPYHGKGITSANANVGHPAPVLTPFNGYVTADGRFPGAVSRASSQFTPGVSLVVTNQSTGIYPSAVTPAAPNAAGTSKSAIKLLWDLMDGLQGKPLSFDDTSSNASNNRQKAELMLLASLQKAAQPRADVVLLQSRDVQLGNIEDGYQDYHMCDNELTDPNIKADDRQQRFQLCELRVALDRIFWKGDYLEYVAATGKDIETILSSSQAKIQQQNELTETDISKEWLVSYGIVQSSLANPAEVNQNNEPLWVPVDPTCLGASAGKSTYCIAQTPIVEDAYYWLVTTDQLAEDRAVYGTLEAVPAANHLETETFITAPLSKYLLDGLSNTRLASVITTPPSGSVEGAVAAQNEGFQQKRLFLVDFAKVVASFTSRQPGGGNSFVGAHFQGVSDARASAPAQQDLDLEIGSRVLADLRVPDAASSSSAQSRTPLSAGLQSAFTYNRAAIGNLLGKPINASYSLNNWTEGAFLQVRLHGKGKGSQVRGVRSLPRSLLVFTPRQYQIEVDNPYLFFSYAASAGSGEYTVQLPRTTGWTDRAGFREEFGQSSQKAFFWNGSYIETGMEFNTQNNVLSSITLQDTKTGTPKTCPVSAAYTLQTCFTTANLPAKGNPALTINGTTQLTGPPAVESLHSPGYYWTIHLQNRLPRFLGKSPDRQMSLVTDTNGDYYFGRSPSAELPTQTEYAIPLSLSLVFPSIGNLTFAPNYSVFFYRPQLSPYSLAVNSWSLSARWYFARDARVPIGRQAPLKGPESSDQTKQGSAH